MDALEETVRAATSKPAQRAAVNTVLVASSTATLLCLATIATALFFHHFVPEQVVTTPIHLQYGTGPNPYGVVSLTKTAMVKRQQEYDVSVSLTMPRSRANTDRGNFMIDLYLLASEAGDALDMDARTFSTSRQRMDRHSVLFRSRRTALVPFVDTMVSVAKRLLFLVYHMLVPSSQTIDLSIMLGERVVFPKGSALPGSAYIEIEAGQDIHIYSAALTMTAQLRGLRWLMFYYRLPTFVLFASMFWMLEVLSMACAWAMFGAFRGDRIKSQDSDQGDDDIKESSWHQSLTFPSYGRQPPLKYEPAVKEETDDDDDDEPGSRLKTEAPAGDADDEGDVHGSHNTGFGKHIHDSGLGTSYSEGGGSSVRRRASRGLNE
ncbi:hypothetical protein CDD81_7049 [Ophiocordyceps australis]|uniref:Seipin n=1 Tax=Ophiocordyceps australis TaxID=1399860 RepID=A0A2C5YHW5_9HYPO|nr:hypothetical protein CDD81_7049 [Ophiocordyceps australis]